MVTLGMSAHTDRMIKLLVENGVTNTAVLERLLVHGIPRVSLLYSSLSCATSCLLTSFSLQAQRYESNTSTTSALSTYISSNSYWTLLMPTSILQGFAHICPFLKGFFQHPASTTSTQQGWFDHGEKKTEVSMVIDAWNSICHGSWWKLHKNVGLPKRWTWDTWIPRVGSTQKWMGLSKTFRFLLFEILSWECILLDWQCVYFDLDSSIYHYIVCLACYLKWNQHLCIDILYIWKFILCTHCI